MKIQLVNAPLLETGRWGEYQTSQWQPMGIMSLAAYVRANCPDPLEIKLTDGTLLGMEKTYQEVLNFSPDVLGISTVTANATGGYDLVNRIKKKKQKTFVIFGGVHASALPEEVCERSKSDLVVLGEGEKTLLEIIEILIKGKKDFSKIHGLAIRKNGHVIKTPTRDFIQNLDTLPFPAHDLLENRDLYEGWYFRKQSPETTIMSTRGCPFHCFFCVDVIWKSSRPYMRPRSPKNIVDELEYLQKNFGIKEFFDVCDEFNAVESWAVAVCVELIKRKLNMTWKCQMRADRVSYSLARKMASAGCWYVNLGVESGNQKTLDGVGKKIQLKQVEIACRNLKKCGIKVGLLMMIFNIWEENGKLAFENVEDSLRSLKFAKDLVGRGLAEYFTWGPTIPYPGSPLYRFALKNNLIPEGIVGHWEKWNNIWGVPINIPGVSRSDYLKVKVWGVFWQTLHVLKNMKRGFNVRSLAYFFRRFFGFLAFFFLATKETTPSSRKVS